MIKGSDPLHHGVSEGAGGNSRGDENDTVVNSNVEVMCLDMSRSSLLANSTKPPSSSCSDTPSSCSDSNMSGIDFYCRQVPIFSQGVGVDYFVNGMGGYEGHLHQQPQGGELGFDQRNKQGGKSSSSPSNFHHNVNEECSATVATRLAGGLSDDCSGNNTRRRNFNHSMCNSPELRSCGDEYAAEARRNVPGSSRGVMAAASQTQSLGKRKIAESNVQANLPLLRVSDCGTKTVHIIPLGNTNVTSQFKCSCCDHVFELSFVTNHADSSAKEKDQERGRNTEVGLTCTYGNGLDSNTGEATAVDRSAEFLFRQQPDRESTSLSLLGMKFDKGFRVSAGSVRGNYGSHPMENETNASQGAVRHSLEDRRRRYQSGRFSQGTPKEIKANDSLFPSLPTFSPTSFVRAYVGEGNLPWEATLDNVPAVTVSCCVAALNLIAVQFLRHHVIDTRDHFCLFATGTYMIFASYFVAYYFLGHYTESFRRISRDKQFYIIANLIKAGILASLVPFATLHLSRIILFDEWDTNTLRNLGCIYTIPDFVSMLIVKRMSWSTWTHHLCVLLFNFFSTMNDYTQENVCRCVVVYAAFSTFAYCVNVLLASRFLGVKPGIARILSHVSVVAYLFFCGLNWVWQTYYIHRLLYGGNGHWTVYVYIALVGLVMYDDVTLCQWLIHNARNTAFAAAHHKEQQRRQ
ncbi:hypothetical protein DPX39_100040500 [Trypanosoma brucei equiperdum]|uniref:Transmembrane protein n=1 Tax=Trypanosoma brucei equiperdum TaxID=630700 RepID=A0A3L6L106_9TRYP|nr:hypothetical protein DPX39_100040500 [Trypanosoma brucei equiperdum]